MNEAERLNEVIGAIYEGGLDSSLWTEAASKIAHATGGFSGALVLWDTGAGKMPESHDFGWPEEAFTAYRNRYINLDPRAEVFLSRRDMRIYTDAMLVAPEVKRRHEFFDWLRKAGDQHHGYGARLFSGNGFESTLIMGRGKIQGEATRDDLNKLAVLLPHLRRAITMGRKLGDDLAKQTLDVLPFGVVVFDNGGKISVVNSAAAQMSARNDGFRVTNRGITLSVPSDDGALSKLLGQFQNRLYVEVAKAPRRLTVARPSGLRPYHVTVYPLPTHRSIAPPRDAVMVCITDPEETAEIHARALIEVHALSPAEADLALSLVQLGSLQAAARHCGLTDGSARQYMKRVFSKTGTSGQVELVTLILKSLRF